MDKLLKILGTIYDTKKRMKAVLGTQSDDICEYPTLIHNYFVDAYNEYYPEGYEDGYNDAWTQILGTQPLVPPTTPQQRQKQEYTPNIPTVTEYRDQRLADNLSVIMEEVYQARLGMKEALGTESDLFVTYPDLLENMIEEGGNFYDSGYEDGWDDAELAINGIELNAPTISRSGETVTITSDYPTATIKYTLDGGVEYTYTEPFDVIIEGVSSVVVTAWVEAGSTGQYRSDESTLTIYSDFSSTAFTIEHTENGYAPFKFGVLCEVNTVADSQLTGVYRMTNPSTGEWGEWTDISVNGYLNIVQLSNSGEQAKYVQVYICQITWLVDNQKIQFKINNPKPVHFNDLNSGSSSYLHNIRNSPFNGSIAESYNFKLYDEFIVYGNIMSLVYGDNYIGRDFDTIDNKHDYLFMRTFSACGVVSAENLVLPSNTTPYCYRGMFSGCDYLTTPPDLSGINNLSEACFRAMFYDDDLLSVLPALPNVSLADSCFYDMFSDCRSIRTIPSNYLPYTSLATGCYRGMFFGCTSLATVPANLLPATTLALDCYKYMFARCTSLTTAPDLPAPILICTPEVFYDDGCYDEMFDSCSNLNYIKCTATTFITSVYNSPTANWVDGVAATGTFVKAAGVEWETGRSGIPTGWTVLEE